MFFFVSVQHSEYVKLFSLYNVIFVANIEKKEYINFSVGATTSLFLVTFEKS